MRGRKVKPESTSTGSRSKSSKGIVKFAIWGVIEIKFCLVVKYEAVTYIEQLSGCRKFSTQASDSVGPMRRLPPGTAGEAPNEKASPRGSR